MTDNHAAATADTAVLTMLSHSLADYCVTALPPARLRRLRQATPPFDRARYREMAQLGWLGMTIPETLGGTGLARGSVVELGLALGRVAAAEPLIESGIACSEVLASAPHAQPSLAALMAGDEILTLAVPRPETPVRLHAQPCSTGFELEGDVDQLPYAPDVDGFLLPAILEDTTALFRVPRRAGGVHIEVLTLADGTRDGRLSLRSVRCPEIARLILQQPLPTVLARAHALAGLAASAYLLGLCESLLDMTLAYVKLRRQFGRTLGSFQALQHRLVDMYLHLRLGKAALRAASDDRLVGARLSAAVARARYRACATTTRIVREAIQLHGAIGYTEQCDVSLFVQRALVVSARYGNALEDVLPGELAPGAGALAEANVLPPPLPHDFRPQAGSWNDLDDGLFRSTVREWIECHYPAPLRHAPDQLRWSTVKDWHGALVARGWAAPAWPVEHGGMGLAPDKMLIFIEEMERWGVARAPDQGIVMLGPILMHYGTAAQRARFLPAALTGEHIWCQGYSEPNAGSDLAALSTRAVLDGEWFVVSGQKTWTTHGLDATHMYCLVRTDPEAKPQAGISFLLIDLRQPGVTVRPIVNLGGHVDFCEVFLDEVRVPRENLVGEINQGWTIAKSLLGHERLFVGSPKLCQHALHQLHDLLTGSGKLAQAAVADRFTRIMLDVSDLEALYAEYAAIVKAGGAPGADISILKIWSTETYVRLSEMMLEAAGHAAGVTGKQVFGDARIDVLSHFYNARPAPIYAGSNEIQRNIVAKLVLGLPS